MTGQCFECGEPVADTLRFCARPATCRTNYNNRQTCEGKRMVALVKAWALGRGGGHTAADPRSREAMRELTRYAKDLNDADRKRGRPDALAYYSALTSDGSMYCDRGRRKL